MLSAILGNPNENGTGTPPSTSFDPNNSWPSVDVPYSGSFGSGYPGSGGETIQQAQQNYMPPFTSTPSYTQSPTTDFRNQYPTPGYSGEISGFSPQLPLPQQPQYILDAARPQRIRDLSTDGNVTTAQSPSSADFPGGHGVHMQQINELVTKPYDYTEGYHFLMKHLPSR